MSEVAPARTSGNEEPANGVWGWVRALGSIDLWAGISMFVVGAVILGSLM
jgi:hypothetical protein